MEKAHERDRHGMLSHIGNFEAHKAVHARICRHPVGRSPRRQFAAAHTERAGRIQCRCPAVFQGALWMGTRYSTKEANRGTGRSLPENVAAEYRERLSAVQEDVKILRDVRHWLNQVLTVRAVPPDRRAGQETVHPAGSQRPGAAYPGGTGRETPAAPHSQKKQDMEL